MSAPLPFRVWRLHWRVAAGCGTVRLTISASGDRSNFVIDAAFPESYMRDPSELLHRIKMLTGVLEVGIFAGMALAAYFGNPDGTVSCRYQDGRRHTIKKSDLIW